MPIIEIPDVPLWAKCPTKSYLGGCPTKSHSKKKYFWPDFLGQETIILAGFNHRSSSKEDVEGRKDSQVGARGGGGVQHQAFYWLAADRGGWLGQRCSSTGLPGHQGRWVTNKMLSYFQSAKVFLGPCITINGWWLCEIKVFLKGPDNSSAASLPEF